jgi:hypothetical protein
MGEIDRFWAWFVENEERIFNMGMGEDAYEIVEVVGKQISRIHPDLMFQFSSEIEGVKEFVISAGGMREQITHVQNMVESAPPLPRWNVIAFRQRMRDIAGYRLKDGSSLKPENVTVSLEPDRGRIGLTLFIEGLDETNRNTFGQLGFLMLDSALGEYDVMTKVGYIDFKPASERTNLPTYSIDQLSEPFDEMYEKISG